MFAKKMVGGSLADVTIYANDESVHGWPKRPSLM